jgi:hypothetical protein
VFARAADISPLIGGDAWAMQYYDGERLDVFGLGLGIHYFMCLIFEGSNRGAFGAVTMFGRRAADQMIDLIGGAAYASKKPEPLPPPKEKEPVREPVAPPPTKEKTPAVAEMEALFDTQRGEPVLEPVSDFDPDALFGQSIDETLADSLFDPDTLSDLAASLAASEGERVGYDKPIDMRSWTNESTALIRQTIPHHTRSLGRSDFPIRMFKTLVREASVIELQSCRGTDCHIGHGSKWLKRMRFHWPFRQQWLSSSQKWQGFLGLYGE